ncbi:MAG TPA: M20/M25/M40 family metallo-hydrolase [Terriglobales bacterium]|nr:M20/M25/M40 family metallo-hydrolase [Terriglobales bacterium]
MLRFPPVVAVAVALAALPALAQSPAAPALNPNAACRQCIESHENFLASDALQGRGSGTRDELIAATYIASQLQAYGVKPGAADGSYIEIAPAPPATAPRLGTTANVVGLLPGRDAGAPVLLLTAHLDHLGINPKRAYQGDAIFNGADDDASGCTAVLELARMLSLGERPKRSVYFAFFGSEETGGAGAKYFVAHPPVPLDRIFANLEFEMIGWPDAAVPAHTLWLTGWQRSNLGPEMAREGAKLVGDPHPAEHFFCRSDNLQLAIAGVVAQTVSSFGLQPMYHRADDDVAHLDFGLMTDSISSMIKPVRMLLNSKFVPAWNPGGRPSAGRGGCN